MWLEFESYGQIRISILFVWVLAVDCGLWTFFNPLTASRPAALLIFLPAAAGVISSDLFARSAEACFRKH
jgi:hypothetical protein